MEGLQEIFLTLSLHEIKIHTVHGAEISVHDNYETQARNLKLASRMEINICQAAELKGE